MAAKVSAQVLSHGKAVAQAVRRSRLTIGDINLALGVAAISIALLALWSNAAHAAGKGTRVKPGEPTRVFVMAGFTPDACAFKGFPQMNLDAQPTKGQVSFKDGEVTTIQYSLSGKCVGTQVQGTAIYYVPASGQVGEDTFTVSGRLGNGEPATRTFSVIIDENSAAQ
jgi:hypothetical protein